MSALHHWGVPLVLVMMVLKEEMVISHSLSSSSSSPSSSSSSASSSSSSSRHTRQLDLSDATLECIFGADITGQDGSSCFPSSSTPPPPSCSCVPLWQCRDAGVTTAVEGDSLSSFALDLRSNPGCGAPEEVCCVDVDVSAQRPALPPVTALCGQRNALGVGTTFLGFEDQQTQFAEFPWTVVVFSVQNIRSDEVHIFTAGGSLVHEQAVMTVAHAVLGFTADQLRVRLGEWNLETQTEIVPHQDIRVKQIVLHPHYHRVHQYYDVALLLLERPAVLGPTVNTICLPSRPQDYLGEECVVSGWGKKRFDDKSKFQNIMKKVSLPVVDHAQCQTALQGTRLGPRFILHDSFLCAGGQEGQDACTGDGGSPLACPLQSDPSRYVQVGVVAWGIGCGRLGLPGVYADVVKVRPWIEQVIRERVR